MLNLGTGRSYSILQIILTIERVTGRPVPIITAFGRPGDPATSLPAERAAAIEYGLTQFQNTLAERDRLPEDLRRAEDRNHLVRAEVEMRDRAIMDLQRRIGKLEADRDRKVADFAILETLFISLRAQLDAFVKLPPAKEVTDSSQC